MDRSWLKRGNLKRETESLQTAVQNIAVRTKSKKKLTIPGRTASVDYVVAEM